MVLLVPKELNLDRNDKFLDPPLRQKWAEEGYAVAQVVVNEETGSVTDQLGTAIAELESLPECEGDKFGLVGNY